MVAASTRPPLLVTDLTWPSSLLTAKPMLPTSHSPRSPKPRTAVSTAVGTGLASFQLNPRWPSSSRLPSPARRWSPYSKRPTRCPLPSCNCPAFIWRPTLPAGSTASPRSSCQTWIGLQCISHPATQRLCGSSPKCRTPILSAYTSPLHHGSPAFAPPHCLPQPSTPETSTASTLNGDTTRSTKTVTPWSNGLQPQMWPSCTTQRSHSASTLRAGIVAPNPPGLREVQQSSSTACKTCT